MRDYPLPSHAAYVWLAGDILNIGLPPTEGHEQGHTVALPATLDGAKTLLAILQERQRLGAKRCTVGTAGSPTQYDLDRIAQLMNGSEKAEKARERRVMTSAEADRKHAERRQRKLDQLHSIKEADSVLSELGLI